MFEEFPGVIELFSLEEDQIHNRVERRKSSSRIGECGIRDREIFLGAGPRLESIF